MRGRLVVLALASTSVVVIAFLVPLFTLVDELATDRATRPAELASRSLAPLAPLLEDEPLRDVLSATAASIEGTASIVRPDGRVVGDQVEIDAAISIVRTSQQAAVVDQDGGRRFLVPVVGDRGVLVVDVRVPVDSSGVRLAQLVLLLLGFGLIAGATALADRLGRSTVAAARRLESTAHALSSGDLGARAEVESPGDLAAVGQALDQLADRITDLLAEQREEAADLSHGLRTPLTALRLDVEALPDGDDRNRVLGDLEELDRAVGDVIAQARAPMREGAGQGTELVAAVRDRTDFWGALATDEGRRFGIHLDERPVRVAVPASELTTLLDVLLDNVFRHTPAGTAIQVVAGPAHGGGRVVVADDGPGYPDHLDVLERGSTSGGGTGLGLDIARRIVEDAGGWIELTSGRDVGTDRGARVGVWLPPT